MTPIFIGVPHYSHITNVLFIKSELVTFSPFVKDKKDDVLVGEGLPLAATAYAFSTSPSSGYPATPKKIKAIRGIASPQNQDK